MQRLKNLVAGLDLSPLNITNINEFDVEDMGDIIVMSCQTEIKAIECYVEFIFKKDSQLVLLNCDIELGEIDIEFDEMGSYEHINLVNMLADGCDIKCYFESDEDDEPSTLIISSAILDINSNRTIQDLTWAINKIPKAIKELFQ